MLDADLVKLAAAVESSLDDCLALAATTRLAAAVGAVDCLAVDSSQTTGFLVTVDGVAAVVVAAVTWPSGSCRFVAGASATGSGLVSMSPSSFRFEARV